MECGTNDVAARGVENCAAVRMKGCTFLMRGGAVRNWEQGWAVICDSESGYFDAWNQYARINIHNKSDSNATLKSHYSTILFRVNCSGDYTVSVGNNGSSCVTWYGKGDGSHPESYSFDWITKNGK